MAELFLKLLNMSISAGWLVIAVVLLRLIFKKAPRWVFCILWGLVALRLVLPVSVESVLSLIPSTDTFPEKMVQTGAPEIHTGIEYLNSAVNPISYESFAPTPQYSANPLQILTAVLGQVWLLGVAAMLLYVAVSYVVVRIKVREAVYEDGVWICDRVGSPFIIGVFCPRIILPSGLSEWERRYVVAHERAHLSRLDHLWKPLGFLVLTVYWFNPLIWVAYVLLCRDIELSCDEKVIKKMGEDAKAPYANALINCSVKKRYITACPLAFGETGVKSRIRTVLHYKKPALWVIVASCVLCALVAVLFLTDPKGEKSTALGEQSTGADFMGVTLEITELETDAPDPYITVKWHNKSMTGIEFGEDFAVYKYTDGVWEDRRLDAESVLRSKVYFVKSGDWIEKTYKLNGMIMTDTGKYRLEAKFSADGSSPTQYTAFVEFELKRQVQGISVHTFVPVSLIYDAPWYSYVQYPENAPTYMIANDMELLEVRNEVVPLGDLTEYDISDSSFGSLFEKDGWMGDDSLASLRENNERAWRLETAQGGLAVLLLQKDGTYLLGVGSAGVGEMKEHIRWLYGLLEKQDGTGTTVQQMAYDNSVYYYTESCIEGGFPNISTYYLMSEDEAEKLYSHLRSKKWQNDAIVDRLEFEYDGKVRVRGQWLYFGYSQKVFYYGGYFLEGADDAVKYLKKLSKGAAPHYPMGEAAVNEKKEVYVFKNSPDLMSPTLILSPDEKRFQFTYSLFSSELNTGTYEISDKTLVLTTEDGGRVYTFTASETGAYVFDAERSEKIPSYKYKEGMEPQCPVPDGAEFLSRIGISPVSSRFELPFASCEIISAIAGEEGAVLTVLWNTEQGFTQSTKEDYPKYHLKVSCGDKSYFTFMMLPKEWFGDGGVYTSEYVVRGEYSKGDVITLDMYKSDDKTFVKKLVEVAVSDNTDDSGEFIIAPGVKAEELVEVPQEKINAVCKNIYKIFGKRDSDTGFEYHCFVKGSFELDGETYYFLYLQWIVPDESGNPHHTSTLCSYVMSDDFTKLYEASFEDEGGLKIHNDNNRANLK